MDGKGWRGDNGRKAPARPCGRSSSKAAAAVRAELKETVKQLVASGAWKGVELLY